MVTIAVIIISFLASLFTVDAVRTLATRHQIGAMPDQRRMHTEFKPVLGGLGIFCGLIAGIAAAHLLGRLNMDSLLENLHIWAGLLAIVLTGLIDDIRGITALQKFIGQFVAALAAAIGGCYIDAFYGPGGGQLALGIFSLPFSILWIMLVINAVNLMDGLDGLAGGVSLITLCGFFIISLSGNNPYLCFMAAALVGALLGFLRHNYHPAKIFMGDVGSLMLGYVLACFSIESLKIAGTQSVFFLASLVMVGMPLTDTLISFFRRMSRGDHPFKPDKEHIHHRLIKLGVTHIDTVWLIYYSTFVYVTLGVLITFYLEMTAHLLFLAGLGLSIFWAWRLGYLETRAIISFGVDEQQFLASLKAPIHVNRIWHQIAIMIGDAVAISAALYITNWFRFQSGVVAFEHMKSIQDYLSDPVFLMVTAFWMLLFWLNGLYRMPWDVSRFDKTMRVTKVISFAVLLLMLLLNFDLIMSGTAKNPFNTSQIATLTFYWLIMVGSTNTIRLIIIEFEKRFHLFEYGFKNTLLVGATRKARNIIRDIEGNSHLLYRIQGVVDKEPVEGDSFEGIPVVGSYDDLPRLILEMGIEEVIVALDDSRKRDMLMITSSCDRMRVVVKHLPALRSIVDGGNAELASHGLVRIFPDRMVLWQWLIKRFMDIFFSLLIAVLTLPLWMMVALYTRFVLGRPVFVKVAEMGRNGRIFNMYHFLTAGQRGLEAKIEKPIDIQPWLVAFFYRTHLYKTAQLFNIFRGDMSFVGPRPESSEWYKEQQNKQQFLHRRLSVRPGISGLAQVKYRFDFSQQYIGERIKFDIYYVENMSLSMDLRIILRSLLLFLS